MIFKKYAYVNKHFALKLFIFSKWDLAVLRYLSKLSFYLYPPAKFSGTAAMEPKFEHTTFISGTQNAAL